jgi:arsenical pump membrane protein
MFAIALASMAATLAIALAWRSVWAPAVGAVTGVAIALAGGAAVPADLARAAHELWRPLIVIVSVMLTAAAAAEVGVFAKLASWIEPRTRGPVRHAFRVTFIAAALTSALLSNDAAILLVTPVVIELLRAVYPQRHVKFFVPFAFAAFVAAGVAPLPTGNPMNLVVTSRSGIGFATYAAHMIPVALVGWVVAYVVLAWVFRDALADEEPAAGAGPPPVTLGREAKVVLVTTALSIASYPVIAALGYSPWVVAAPAALICLAAARTPRVLRDVSWELVPFLFGVLVLATALARAGVTGTLSQLYVASPAPRATIGAVATVGSAIMNNHPMALLHSLALADQPDSYIYAALVGGDLGPRLLPVGSLAGLLWLDALRRRGISVPLRLFIR